MTELNGSGGERGNAIEARHLNFSFHGHPALNDLSLTVPEGVAYGLLGPNGSGKTTFIRILAGLLHQQSGEIRMFGEAISSDLRNRIGYMPQSVALYESLTVRENIEFFARMYGMSNRSFRRQKTKEVLELVGLGDRGDDSVRELSGGMRQRVSLAVAMVHNPPLLLLDEPTVGLDPELRASFWAHFKKLTEAGTTLIVSSHTMDDAAHCDRLGFLLDGTVIADGTPRELAEISGSTDGTLEATFLNLVRQARASVDR